MTVLILTLLIILTGVLAATYFLVGVGPQWVWTGVPI